ncbi:MAG: Ig-like domain-containing protein [Lachnospiraceae bacterium]|nr:Ig-like domain-containing protein [Lachnospiraceae bacterium]
MFNRLSKRLVSSISLLLAASMLFTDVAGVYADELSSNDTVIESVLDSVEETEELSAETEAYDAAYLAKDAVGSDGVAYEGVNYISNRIFLALPKESQEAYINSCDSIREMKESGLVLENVVLGADEEGNVYFRYYVTPDSLVEFQSKLMDSFVDDVSANVLAFSDVSFNDVSFNDISGNEKDSDTTDELTDVSANDISDNESSAVKEDVISSDVSANSDSFSENMEFFTDIDDEGETIEGDFEDEIAPEANEYDTLLNYKNNTNYFYDQLTSDGKNVFNAMKKTVLDGKKTKVSFSAQANIKYNGLFFTKSVAGIVWTYNSKMQWFDGGYNGTYQYNYGARKYTYSITFTKSKFYSADLHNKANKVVKQIVTDAYDYAKKNYSSDIVLGILTYADEWLCKNNHYEHNALDKSWVKKHQKQDFFCHSPYGCLTQKYGVCESYAEALSWILDYAGVPNMYVVSSDHAFNYVQMPNDIWYLIDSTWDDQNNDGSDRSSSSKQFFLKKDPVPNGHIATGEYYIDGGKFKYPTLATSNYSSVSSSISLNKGNFAIAKGKTTTLKINKATYYEKFKKTWTSSNTKAATINSSGKVSAKAPGTANLSVDIAGKKASVTATVYSLKNLTYEGKTSGKRIYADADANITGSETDSATIVVNQNDYFGVTAEALSKLENGPKLSVSNSKKAVAEVTSYKLSGNNIILSLKPKKLGTTTITVKFGGKTAKLSYSVKYQIQGSWFDFSKVKNETYSGKAYKPSVKKSTSFKKGATYSVVYTNNKNAGTATVTVKGTKNYTGTVSRTFTISRLNIAGLANVNGKKPAEAKIKAKTYNGSVQNPSITVKYKGKSLKKDKDFTVSFNASPVKVGTYNVSITGIGNYSGNIASGLSFTINKVKAKNLKVSVTASRTYTGVSNPPTVTVKAGGKALPTSDYTISYKMKKTGVAYTSPSDVGTYEVTITYKGTNIDTAGKASVTKTYKITAPKKKKK